MTDKPKRTRKKRGEVEADPERQKTGGTRHAPPEHTWWKPGVSGNPGGRPRVVGELKELARSYTLEAMETLAKVMRDDNAPPAARVAAVGHILDRGYGKPTQHISQTVRQVREMTDAELLAFLAGPVGEADGGDGDVAPPLN